MNLKDEAKLFAINAHMGQIRKSEPDKPMIVHPLGVGKLLEEYGFDDDVIAAGYLHDVVEDTKYTIYDIENRFGKEVANLVMGASEPDKSLSWEERKRHTILETKKLPLKNKVVICADKISNLEDLMINFEKNGKRDFSAFKRGEEQQKWYYTSVYESLIYNEDKDLPIFKRLKNVLDVVFYGKEDLLLKNAIFEGDLKYYNDLKMLHAQKNELQKLKELCSLQKPFVIEFCGTPRTGKTTVINNIFDFFKKGGFRVLMVEEFTTSKYYKENLKKKFDKISVEDRNVFIIEQVYNQLLEAINSDFDIVLIDRTLCDRLIWNYIKYTKGEMSLEVYNRLLEKYSLLSKKIIDYLAVFYTDSLTSLKRDYVSSLALEERSFLNLDNINDYNNSLRYFFGDNVVDTTNLSIRDVSVNVTSEVMSLVRKRYIDSFKNKYNLK